jgi:WD40 repeat protein
MFASGGNDGYARLWDLSQNRLRAVGNRLNSPHERDHMAIDVFCLSRGHYAGSRTYSPESNQFIRLKQR